MAVRNTSRVESERLPWNRSDDSDMLRRVSSPPDDVIGIDDSDADEVLDVLSTESARQILVALNDDSATVSELADRTGLTPQNVYYHLEKLTETDLVRIEGTRGTDGNEATMYAPARSIAVFTRTNSGFQLRPGVVGLLAGSLLSLACLSSVLGTTFSPLLVIHQLVHLM